jgi:hypothetical protein
MHRKCIVCLKFLKATSQNLFYVSRQLNSSKRCAESKYDMLSEAEVRCAVVAERSRSQRSLSHKANRSAVLLRLWWLSEAETSGVEVSSVLKVYFGPFITFGRNAKAVLGSGLQF